MTQIAFILWLDSISFKFFLIDSFGCKFQFKLKVAKVAKKKKKSNLPAHTIGNSQEVAGSGMRESRGANNQIVATGVFVSVSLSLDKERRILVQVWAC